MNQEEKKSTGDHAVVERHAWKEEEEDEEGDFDQDDDDNNDNVPDLVVESFKDESTECAICLGSLDDPDMEVIELTTCGHRWHLECLKQQLEQAQPNPAQRLVLTGCRCAKCGSVCDHPALRHLTRKTDMLREKVDAVLKDQLDPSQQDSAMALEEARRKFAVYMCSHCKEPYFGGTIACADTVEGEVPPDERLCVACAPQRLQQQAQCRHPLEHRGYHVWKCRYCCSVATHVCYGTVHFCDDCHNRNSERVELIRRQKQQQQFRRRQRRNNNSDDGNQEPPSCLTAIPCPGETCPFPKPQGETHHKNGKSADCEQVYGCGWCQSNPEAAHGAFDEPVGSRNLLYNSSGQNQLQGWKQLNPHAHWRVEQSEVPLGGGGGRNNNNNNNHHDVPITTNFVSTYNWCAMSQLVPLYRYVRDPSQVRIEASAKYMARTDCASVFRMELMLLDRNHRPLSRQRTGILEAPADFWERASLTMEPTPGAYEAVILICGKDVPFWAGYFGSKVTDCQIRVLVSPEELERFMIPPEQQQQEQQQQGVAGWLRRAPQQQQQQQQQYEPWWRNRILEILPVVCLIILAWLVQ